MSVLIALGGSMVLAGCSTKYICPKPHKLVVYKTPPKIAISIDASDDGEFIDQLENAIHQLLVSNRERRAIIEAYEKQTIQYNKETEK